MSIAHDLLLGAALAGPIALGLLLVVAATRSADANSHDLSDYHEPIDAPTEKTEPDPTPQPEPDRAAVIAAVVASQPFDPATVPWTPPYADLVIAQVLRRYGDSPEDIARRWLSDIAADERRQAVPA